MGAGRAMWARGVGLAALCMLLTGCYWTQPGFNSHRTGHSPHEHAVTAANAPTLAVDWSAPDLLSIALARSPAGLHVLGDDLTTIDPADGSVLWTADVEWAPLGVPEIAAIDSVLYVPTYQATAPHGCLARFDAASGADLGCLPFAPPATNAAVEMVTRGRWIALTTANYGNPGDDFGTLSVFDTARPERSWSWEISPGSSVLLTNPLIIGNEVVLVWQGEAQGEATLGRWPLVCDVPTCAPTAAVPLPLAGHDRMSASADGTRLAVQGFGGAAVLSAADASVLWTADLGPAGQPWPWAPPTWTPDSVVFATVGLSSPQPGTTRLHRFPADGCDSPTCAPTWSADLAGFLGGQVAAAADVLVASTAEQPLVVFPEQCTNPCEPVLDIPGWTFWGAPILQDGRIYVTGYFEGATDPELRAYATG